MRKDSQEILAQVQKSIKRHIDPEIWNTTASIEEREREAAGCQMVGKQALWHILQSYLIKQGSRFPVTERTLFSLLQKRGLLAETDKGRNTKVERIEGKLYRVLKISKKEVE